MFKKGPPCLSSASRLSLNRLWAVTRRFWFALVFISVICAKLLHIYSHRNSLSVAQFLAWGATFFIQDAICIGIFWFLTRSFDQRWARILIPSVTIPAALGISSMASANTSFYITTGAEIHWRQAHYFHRDAASIKTLLSGLAGTVGIELLLLVLSYFASPSLFDGVERYWSILASSVAPLYCSRHRRMSPKECGTYEAIADDNFSDTNLSLLGSSGQSNSNRSPPLWKRFLVIFPTVFVLLLRCIRPSGPAYGFLSQTLPLTPFASPNTDNRNTLLGISEVLKGYTWLGNRTALASPPDFNWLTSDALPGFWDWSSQSRQRKVHYNPKHDPLHISNLDGKVIEPLSDLLKSGDVQIKHIILLKLESTRYDVFPIRAENYIHNRIRQSYGGQIPGDVEERLANLTRTAERLVGVKSGLHDDPVKPYGGIHATNSHTAGTFTLKSLTGSVCGISPLVADFNREYLYHIYQPCIPHILDALSTQIDGNNTTEDFTSWPWKSVSMQSITDLYDNQNLLTPKLGFQEVVNVDTIDAEYAKNPSSTAKQMNFWGYHDSELRSSFRDAIQDAEQNRERLFITHLTGGTHHPWDTPDGHYEEMVGSTWLPINKNFNRYLNTIGLADQWLAEIIQILEETGVAEQTLFVMTGDHGITLPEDGGVTPYDNPHISNFHVPLVFAHPKLPPIELDFPVNSIQILPTILDLLRESGSLNEAGMNIINDLLPMYEGQSIIRPPITEENGKEVWQFSVMNTGGTWLAVRSAARPYRLVIPLIPDVEWRFSDVRLDPQEEQYIMSFDLPTLLKQVEECYDVEPVTWIKDAAYVSQWWLRDNWRRYEYDP